MLKLIAISAGVLVLKEMRTKRGEFDREAYG